MRRSGVVVIILLCSLVLGAGSSFLRVGLQWYPKALGRPSEYTPENGERRVRVSVQSGASWDEFLSGCRDRLGLDPSKGELHLYAVSERVQLAETEALEEGGYYTLAPGAQSGRKASRVRRGYKGSGIAPAGSDVPSWDPMVVQVPGGYRVYFLRDPDLPVKERTGQFWLHSWIATAFSKVGLILYSPASVESLYTSYCDP